MTWTIYKEIKICASHQLKLPYESKCNGLHGHNYRVLVTAAGPELDEGGMLLDFGAMKAALRRITAELDHGSLNDHPAFSDGCPSSERMRHSKSPIRRRASTLGPRSRPARNTG